MWWRRRPMAGRSARRSAPSNRERRGAAPARVLPSHAGSAGATCRRRGGERRQAWQGSGRRRSAGTVPPPPGVINAASPGGVGDGRDTPAAALASSASPFEENRSYGGEDRAIAGAASALPRDHTPLFFRAVLMICESGFSLTLSRSIKR